MRAAHSARAIAIALAALCATAWSARECAAQEVALFADGDGVSVRNRPSLEGTEVVARLSRGDEVRVQESSGQWRKVWLPKTQQIGWVAHWLLAEVPPPGYRHEVAYVVDNGVTIRTGPGESHDRKGVLDKGVQVDVIAYAEQWRKIRVPANGEWGWVAGWLLKSAGGSSGDAGAGTYGEARWIGSSDVNLRGGPGTDGEPLGRLGKGTKVYLMTLQGDWAKVHVHEGPVGWVHRDFLKPQAIPGATGGVSGSKGESSWGAPRWVGVDELYLRPGPDADNRPLALLTKGKRVYIMYLQEEWAQVHVHDGNIGWVFRDYLRDDEPTGGSAQAVALTEQQQRDSFDEEIQRAVEGMDDNQAIVLNSGTNVRAGPGTMFPVVDTASRREKLKVYGQASGWLKVGNSAGQDGWVATWLVAAKVQPEPLPADRVPAPPSVAVTAGSGDPQGTGKRIAELALSQIGKPYVWGAESPSVGFDCSGLAYWSHGQVGIGLQRTSFAMWDDPRGKAVPRDALQPGDVVCFANTYAPGVSHVGIYVGDGKFVHAPGTGRDVRVDDLSSRSRSYCGARRFY